MSAVAPLKSKGCAGHLSEAELDARAAELVADFPELNERAMRELGAILAPSASAHTPAPHETRRAA